MNEVRIESADRLDVAKRSNKGFTLMEMLIVVAIIAILVAIAIPLFTTQLNNAKDAADQANARSIYAMVMADYMDNNSIDSEFGEFQNQTFTIDTPNDGSQTFTFSDRTSGVTVQQGSNGLPEVVVASAANNGNGFKFPQ